MKMKESYGLCPYLAEMEREAKRNAVIRDLERVRTEEDAEMDIPGRLMAHIRRRKDRPARARWISLAADFEKKLNLNEPVDLENAKRYLMLARREVKALGRKEKEKVWQRDLRAGRMEIAT